MDLTKGTKLKRIRGPETEYTVFAGPFPDPDAGGGAFYQVFASEDPDFVFDMSVSYIARCYRVVA